MFRNFFVMIASLFIPEELAEAEGVRNGAWFDFERANPTSPLSREAIPDSYDRISYAFSGWFGLVREQDQDALHYAMDLAEFADLSFGIASGKVSDVQSANEAKELEVSLWSRESNHPEIAKLLTVDQVKAAAIQGNWS